MKVSENPCCLMCGTMLITLFTMIAGIALYAYGLPTITLPEIPEQLSTEQVAGGAGVILILLLISLIYSFKVEKQLGPYFNQRNKYD